MHLITLGESFTNKGECAAFIYEKLILFSLGFNIHGMVTPRDLFTPLACAVHGVMALSLRPVSPLPVCVWVVCSSW